MIHEPEGAPRLVRGTLLAVLALVLSVTGQASGQGTPVKLSNQLTTCGRDSVGLGRIRGMLVADSTGVAIDRQVVVARNACAVASDSAGAFMLRGLPAGTYEVLAGPGAHAILPPVRVRVGPDSTSTITIHLRAVDRIYECRQFPECAAMLEAPPAALLATLSDSDRIREATFRTAVAMTALPQIAMASPRRPNVYRLSTEPHFTQANDGIVAAVRARVPTAEALLPGSMGPGTKPTPGVSTWLIGIMAVQIAGDRATVRGGSGDTGWEVTLDHTAAGWRPIAFRVTGIR